MLVTVLVITPAIAVMPNYTLMPSPLPTNLVGIADSRSVNIWAKDEGLGHSLPGFCKLRDKKGGDRDEPPPKFEDRG